MRYPVKAMTALKILRTDDLGQSYPLRTSPSEVDAVRNLVASRLGEASVPSEEPVDIREYALEVIAANAAAVRRIRELNGPEAGQITPTAPSPARVQRLAAELAILDCL